MNAFRPQDFQAHERNSGTEPHFPFSFSIIVQLLWRSHEAQSKGVIDVLFPQGARTDLGGEIVVGGKAFCFRNLKPGTSTTGRQALPITSTDIDWAATSHQCPLCRGENTEQYRMSRLSYRVAINKHTDVEMTGYVVKEDRGPSNMTECTELTPSWHRTSQS